MHSPTLQQSLPYGEGISPLRISDEEELERLAGLQLRDSLVRGLGVSEQLQISLDQMSSSRPPSTMPSDPAPRPHPQAGPMFFTHVVHNKQNDSGVDESHSSSSLPSESNVLMSVTNSTDCTPLHCLPGVRPKAGHEAGPGPSGKPGGITSQNLQAGKRSHSYSLGYGYAPQHTSMNSLSAAYHRPTYAFGSTVK